ncbi:hypothetical protein [Streptomyces sp. MP131-18]|uniref:hypothetical protein n=1 Tax=Streptomyces sp. MP131-18 TaxID=1857892 RepID=UPI00097C02A0|nr:hypothetical protein [Streptomyces sp. MP131-18]ONK15690.1 hypothetical protein STBA_65290 [Streptomyces sp. MP131-18]
MAHTTREQAPDSANRPLPATPQDHASAAQESRGCLFALSQPPLMLFLTVIGALLLIAGLHDQFLL